MTEYTSGKIMDINLVDEMKQSYIDYAMSVIVNRALPDVRDGLKPVHRRILFSMRELGMTPDKGHKKSARVVGDVIAKYHPHSDTSVYDAVVRMAQGFSMRYRLVDGHGNFGSIDGDPAAAMRYTEARLTSLSMELLRDLEKNTIDYQPNFDDSLEEPSVLPARFPNILVNGSSGIAVGMATNIPPHNLTEVINATIALIDNPLLSDDELLKIVTGPDFPTSGVIVGREGIRQAYKTGRGVITIRSVARIEAMSNGKNRILITELPYQVNKARLIEKIAQLVHEKQVEGITDLRDESDRTGLRIVVELSKNANANVVLNKLYKHTQMQVTFGIIMLALVNREPRTLSLKQVIKHYLDHQKEVITRRTQFDLAKAEARAHILEGLRIALDYIDEVIALIRASKTTEEARTGLMEKFALSDKQAQAILDMRLQRLTGLERTKIEDEYQALLKDIEYYRAVLGSEEMLMAIVKQELEEVRDRFGDERRTKIVNEEGQMNEEDLIAEEDVVITLTHQGYIKRLPVDTYRTQKRGGKGIIGMSTKEEDFVEQLFITTTHHYLLFFTNRGRAYRVKVHEIPEASRQAKGTAVVNLIPVEPGELVNAVISVKEFDENKFLVMATRKGMVKRLVLNELANMRKTGLIALSLGEDDELIRVHMTEGNQEVMLITQKGKTIRFPESEIRVMGRTARGVIGIKLSKGDAVVALNVVDPEASLMVMTKKGFGKKTPLSMYRAQSRAGKGIITATITDRNGPLVGAMVVRDDHEVMLISDRGIVIRCRVADVSMTGRSAQGVSLMRVGDNDELSAFAPLVQRSEENGE